MVATKYGEDWNGWLPAILLGALSWVWKGICAGNEQFSYFIWFKVNEGDRVLFWPLGVPAPPLPPYSFIVILWHNAGRDWSGIT